MKHSLTTYILLPIVTNIDGNFKKYIVDENAFNGAYHEDINIPYLDNNCFVLFDTNKMNWSKYKELCNLHNFKYVRYLKGPDDDFYAEYIFDIDEEYNSVLNALKNNSYYDIDHSTKSKIYKYWGEDNNELHSALFVKSIEPIDTKNDIVHEMENAKTIIEYEQDLY